MGPLGYIVLATVITILCFLPLLLFLIKKEKVWNRNLVYILQFILCMIGLYSCSEIVWYFEPQWIDNVR